VKYFGLTKELHSKLLSLSFGEENGIPGVRVKSVDIGRNTSGESDSLDKN
jgi:hypothetical protein